MKKDNKDQIIIRKYTLGKLQTNCYLCIAGKSCIIVDPVDDADFLLEEIQRQKLNLVGLVATHGHFDHIMAVGEIQLSFSLPLYIKQKDVFLVKRLQESAEYFLGPLPEIVPVKNISFIVEPILAIDSFRFQVIACPGHTPGGISLYLPDEGMVFSGDTLFKGSVGRHDFSYSNKEDLKTSISSLYQLPDLTTVYPGHGADSIMGREKEYAWDERL